MKKGLIIYFILLITPHAYSQVGKTIIDQSHFWISTNNVYRYSEKCGVVTDFHIRKTDFINDPNFYFMRLGLRYWVLPKITLTGGYAHMWLAVEQENGFGHADENRIYQEALFKNIIKRSPTLFRIRTEQRWREKLDIDDQPTGNYLFNYRFRVLFSTSIPITKGEWPWNLLLADEVLFNYGEPIVYNTFDQNRLTIGVKKRITKNWSFDLGYMMVYQQLPVGSTYHLNHTFRLFFYGIFDFRKNIDPDSKLMIDHAEE